MFYKGYRYLVIILIVLLLFLLGFIIQIRYLKNQLNELERVNKFVYSYLLLGQFKEIEENFPNNTVNYSQEDIYNAIDSVLEQRFLHYFEEEDVSYKLKDSKGMVVYLRHGKKDDYNNTFLTQTFFEVAQVRFGKNDNLTILIPDKIAKQNQTILLLFTLLWILFTIITLGFIIYLWEKQRRMQKIRLDVINNMSHEFKTPLTSIQLISEMFLQQGAGMKEEKLKQYAGIIHQESEKMLQQAKQILNSAYYDQGKVVLRKRVFNIHGLIEYIINSYTTVFKEDELHISLNLKADEPFVLTDRNHFVNVMTNLLDNARKYSRDNHAEVVIATFNENNKLFVEVRDNGIGIDSKHQKLIFDRFYRVPSGNVHEKSGYGVGLYYVKTILKKLNSDIKVKSRKGYGSTFIIQIKNIQQSHKKQHNYGEGKTT